MEGLERNNGSEDGENQTIVDPIPAFEAPFEERLGGLQESNPVRRSSIPQ
jgi:hypothetical protein